MAENRGHFEKGRWVEEEEIGKENIAVTEEVAGDGSDSDQKATVEDFDKKAEELKSSVKKNLNDLFGLGKDLLMTESGREHLGKKVKKAEKKFEETIEDIADSFEKALKK